MRRVPALGVSLVLVAAMLVGLELGPLRRMARVIGANELAVQRALLWTVAMFAGVLTYTALRFGAELYYRLDPAARPAPDARRLPDRSMTAELLEELVEQMSEGVVGFDPSGRVTFSNAAGAELLGRRAIPTGTPMAAFSDIAGLRSTAVRALRTRETTVRELDVAGPPRRTVTVRVNPTRDGGVVLVLLDVSDLRKMERSWRDFVANASHELRTPTAAILANIEALTALSDAPAEIRERLGSNSHRQAERLARLVSDLMDLVRIESGQHEVRSEPIDLDEIVPSLVDQHRAADDDASARLSARVDGHPVAIADATAVTQILTNLITNALRYTDHQVEVRARGRGHLVRIEVRDHGPGIPEEHRSRIFERFHRVDPGRSRDLGGTGLGLSIVRELVDAMGGTIGVDANAPTGSVFWVELPREATIEGEVHHEAAG